MIARDIIFQANIVKQALLTRQPFTHHGPNPSLNASGPKTHIWIPNLTRIPQMDYQFDD